MAFTALDIIVILLVGGGLVFGWLRGFVAEVLSLFAWFLAILALRVLHPPLSDALEGPIGTVSGAAVLAFIIIFGLVFVGGKFASRRVGGRVRNSIVGPLDRVLGAAFGALKGLIGVTILFMILNIVYSFSFMGGAGGRPEWMTNAATYGLLKATSGTVSGFVADQQNAMNAAEEGNAQNATNRQ
ncbi:MAG TPA: CvpA family protein [Allosphingosinicella sp.]|nr:CvpA family protein [Allosphingosinicella sp.]